MDILVIVIVVVIVIALALYGIFLSKQLNSGVRDTTTSELAERRQSIKVSPVHGFIPPKLVAFYDVLKAAMPSHYIILPNIAMELLFQRANRKELQLAGQYVSFVAFTKAFAPVLAIQANDFSEATDSVFVATEEEKALVRGLGIPFMEYPIRDNYNIDDLRRAIAKAMNPLFSIDK